MRNKNSIKMKILIFMLMGVIMTTVGCSKIPIENQIVFPQFVSELTDKIEGTEDNSRGYIVEFVDKYKKYDFEDSFQEKYYEYAKSYAKGDIDKLYISSIILREYKKDINKYIKENRGKNDKE